ncbi:MAG: Gmad2 immunoglobulin-like domain-containing protein [Nostocoides sp.]
MNDHTQGDFTDTEDALRHALAHDAGQVTPPERLGAILRDAQQPPVATLVDEPFRQAPRARLTWLAAGAAAAAVVAAVAIGVAVADRNGTALPGGTGSSTAPTGPATGTATGSSSGPSTRVSGTTTGTSTGNGAVVALPVYYLGTKAGGSSPAALVREFVPVDLQGVDTPSTRVNRALNRALAPTGTPYASTGPGVVTASVGAVSSSGIDITLSSDTGKITLTSIQEAAVTYTAQAAAALGDVPVTIDLNPHRFGPLVRAGTFTRKDFAASVLAPIWIDSPHRGQTFPAGRAITVTGLASVFEARFGWEVRQGSTVVSSGSTMAAAGAPARGAYTISVAALPVGTYTLRLFEESAKGDGTLAAEVTMTLSVG